MTRLIAIRFPYLPLTLVVRGRMMMVEALLDTGFNGYVIVPPGLVRDDQPPDLQQRWSLADGSPVETAAYLGPVRLEDLGTFDAPITVFGDEALVGRRLIDRFTIILDHGTRLIVGP